MLPLLARVQVKVCRDLLPNMECTWWTLLQGKGALQSRSAYTCRSVQASKKTADQNVMSDFEVITQIAVVQPWIIWVLVVSGMFNFNQFQVPLKCWCFPSKKEPSNF